jgi:hypothetical protein
VPTWQVRVKFTVTCYLKHFKSSVRFQAIWKMGAEGGLGELRHDERSIASVTTDAITAKIVFTAQICMRIKAYTDNIEERLKIGCIT